MPEPAPREGLHRAFDQDQLVLFYQPIHELDSRRIISAEALLRARRSTGEIRSGARLAMTAEEGPELFRLDSFTMHRAYTDAAHWQKHGAPDVRINVNLSPREFQERQIPGRLKKLVAGCGIDTRTINLEITEVSYMEKPEEAVDVLHELRELGVQVWLDDFGTGHSSLSHVHLFPIDGLKLPAQFVEHLPSSERSRALVRALISLAHDLDMKVIAEGVENEDQLAFLREHECDYIQGFLFSKPMPVEEFEKLVTE